MNRNPRVFHDRFGQVNADVVIVPKVARYSGVGGQAWGFDVAVASGGRALDAGVLNWSCAGTAGELAFCGAAALSVTDLEAVALILPDAGVNRMVPVVLELVIGAVVVQRTQVDLALFAPRQLRDLPKLAAQDAALARRAAGLGYPLVRPAEADLILTHGLDAVDRDRLMAGARYLVLADGSAECSGLDTWAGLGVTARHGTLWRGDWIAGFSWIGRTGAFAGLPGGPMLDLSYSGVVPHHVMTGWQDDFDALVQAGVEVGWVHKPAALIAVRPVGRGVMTASTFRLITKAPGADPLADALFDALVAEACGQ